MKRLVSTDIEGSACVSEGQVVSDTLRTIFGTIRRADGVVLPGLDLVFNRIYRGAQAQGLSLVPNTTVIVTTNGTGDFSLQLMAGQYAVSYTVDGEGTVFRICVPDQLGPFDITSLIDTVPVRVSNLDAFGEITNQVKAWASAPEDQLVIDGLYSARHYHLKTAVDALATAEDRVATGLDAIAAQEAADAAALSETAAVNAADLAVPAAAAALQSEINAALSEASAATYATRHFGNVAEMLASPLTYTAGSANTVVAGDHIRTQDKLHGYDVLDPLANEVGMLTTSLNGVKIKVLQGQEGYDVSAFGEGHIAAQKAIDTATGSGTAYGTLIINEPVSITQTLVISGAITIKGNGYITQPNGANLAKLVEVKPLITDCVDIQIRVDGNMDNNATVIGMNCSTLTGPMAKVECTAVNCDVGLRIEASSEAGRYDVYAQNCGTACQYDVDVSAKTPDENEIHIYAKSCTTFFHAVAGNITANVFFNCEAATGIAVHIEAGRFFLNGIIRGIGGNGQPGLLVNGPLCNVTNNLRIQGVGASSGLAVDVVLCETLHGFLHVLNVGSGIHIQNVLLSGELTAEVRQAKDASGFGIKLGNSANVDPLRGFALNVVGMHDIEGDGIVWDKTSGSVVTSKPRITAVVGTEFLFREGRFNDHVEISRFNLVDLFVDQGAADSRPVIKFFGPIDDDARATIATPLRGMQIFNPGDNLPNYYDGSVWRTPSGATT